MDIFGLLLGGGGEAGMPALTPDLSAKLSALLQNPAASSNGALNSLLNILQPAGGEKLSAEDLAAKLSALLQKMQAPAEAKAETPLQIILKALEPAKADAPAADPAATKLAALLQSLPAIQKPIQPTLTSDLAAASAPALQEASDKEAALSDTELAELLDNIEPQAAETAKAPAAIDKAVLAELKARLDDGTLKPEGVAGFLKEKGFGDAMVEKYAAAITRIMSGAATIGDVAPDEAPVLTAATPPPKAKAEAATREQPAAQDAAPAEAGQQPRKADAPAKPAVKTAAHPAAVNDLATQDAAQGGPPLQNSTSALALSAPGGDAVVGVGAAPSSFVNHMTIAREAAAPATQMVAVQLQASASNKIDMMTIALEPAQLGRLDIRMKFGKDGTIRAHLSADKPETLALLQKDAGYLHRALQQAGFDADDTTLSFDLRQDAQHQGANHAEDDRQGRHNGYNRYANEADSAALTAKIAVQAYGYVSQGGVNIMV